MAPFIFRLRPPTAHDVANLVGRLANSAYTYPDVGATQGTMPSGWAQERTRGTIGRGEAMARKAEAAVRAWTMFDLDWVKLATADALQVPGASVAFVARTWGVYTINVCRVVYRIEEDDGVVRRSGFAYGTLPGHVVCGEERFELAWDRRTDDVEFEIRKFSRPNQPALAVLGPLVRNVQSRFNVDALQRIERAVIP